MGEKKILMISRSFYPLISPRSFRATDLAKEFVRQGNRVKVLTVFIEGFDYNELGKALGIQFANLGKAKFRGFILKGKGISLLFKRFANRVFRMVIEYPDIQLMPLVVKALRQESDYNLMISFSVPYPIHWGVAWARTKNHRIADKWIADCGDPYMGDQMDTIRKLFYFKYVEKWFCRKADYITINVSDGHKSYYPEFHEKIKYIPRGINFDEVKISDNYVLNTPIRFAYAGGFIPYKRDPRPFIEYLLSLEIDFEFVIFTQRVALVNSYAEKFPGKIIIKDYIPRLELIKYLSTVDFLVNFDNNRDATFPSKLVDYAITKRPILNIKSTLDKVAISAFLARDYSKSYCIENLEQYNISTVAKQFLDLD